MFFTLFKLEQEIFKVHKAHEELVQSCDRRERLERAVRARLQADCRRYQDLNRTLREQVTSTKFNFDNNCNLEICLGRRFIHSNSQQDFST